MASGHAPPTRNDAGSSGRGAGGESLAGAAGSAGDESAAGEAGVPSAAGAPTGGNAGTSPASGGVAGSSAGASGGSGGTIGSSGGAAGTSGSAGTFSGPCGDMDGNAVDDCSETLVQNSRFDNSVEHWTSGAWNASNAQPTGQSGSLLVLNDSPVIADTGFKLTAAEQCIQVTGDYRYEVAARVMIPANQGGGFGGINLLIYANDGCTGTFVTGLSPATTQVTNAWTVVSAQFMMPTAARSMIVRLAATRPFAQPKLQVLFDDILVKQKLP